MTARSYYHVGILVGDIEAARERFSAATGLGFTPVRTIHVERFEDERGRRPLDITLCYSTVGPPFLELVQADPAGGVFGAHHGEGFHHLGFHAADLQTWLEARSPRGEPEAARFRGSDAGRLASFFIPPAALHGVRLEIVDERGRPAFLSWLRDQGAEVSG
jgi:catechol 2,3-dioxygenase-like lactoylglutathione lyase family enzyme